MISNPFSNFNYRDLDTTIDGVHEICVTYQYNGKNLKRIVFIKNKKGINYINQAKKIIDQDIHNGKLLKYSKKMSGLKVSAHPGLKIALAASLVVAGGLSGFIAYKYLKSGDTPSEKSVKVGLTTEVKDAIDINKEEAIVGKNFNAVITVKEDAMIINYIKIKVGEKELKENDDYTLTETAVNKKHSYNLKVFAKAVTDIIQIIDIFLVPEGEDWKTITTEKAVEIAKNCVSNEDPNAKRITSLLRKKGAQGKLTVLTEEETPGSASEIKDTIEFDLRSMDKAVDKDVYIKHMSENDKTRTWSKNYSVYLPNSKNKDIVDTGIYFFSADDKYPSPTAIKSERAICDEADIEKMLSGSIRRAFGAGAVTNLLEGGQEGLSVLRSLIDLFNEEKHPEFKSGEFKSKDDNSLFCSFEGSCDFKPLLNEEPAMRLNIKVTNARFIDFICNEALINVTATAEGEQVMSANMSIKLDYEDIVNEYDPSWIIKEE